MQVTPTGKLGSSRGELVQQKGCRGPQPLLPKLPASSAVTWTRQFAAGRGLSKNEGPGAGAGAGAGPEAGQHAGLLYVAELQSPPGGLSELSGTQSKEPGKPVSRGLPLQQYGICPVEAQPVEPKAPASLALASTLHWLAGTFPLALITHIAKAAKKHSSRRILA